jgi:hypothetical protein
MIDIFSGGRVCQNTPTVGRPGQKALAHAVTVADEVTVGAIVGQIPGVVNNRV